MSKLEELIQRFCPNGVELVELREAFDIKNGYTPSKSNTSFWEKGSIPWFRMEDIRENGHILSDSLQHITSNAVKGALFPANSIIIATSATIGEHALITVESLANQRFTYLTRKPKYVERIDPMFAYYYAFKLDKWCLNNTNISSFASVDMAKFARFKISIPPLPVQREIVRILDNFAEQTAELTTKLAAELTARKKQYEYYRNALLNFGKDEVQWMTIGDVCEISRGKVISKGFIRDNPGKYPVYSSQTEKDGILGRIAEYDYDGKYLTWTTDGANAGTIFYRNGRFNITNVCGLLRPKSDAINIRYLYFILSITAEKYVSRGMGNPKLMSNVMAKIRVPIPSLEEQEHIVSILDHFDALYSDITSGLPVEIEASRKQYEYYRDKLLTFREVSA